MASSGVPPPLKKIQPYLTVAKQFRQRDAIVSYYLKMFAIQEGMVEAKGDPAGKAYILGLMDDVEQMKKELKYNEDYAESISNDTIAQAHIEGAGLKLFNFADSRDRQGQFDKAVIKSFYTSSIILSSLRQFGESELDEEIEKKVKYAKWKAVEIDRCLKAGITPTPGPPVQEADEFGEDNFGGPPMPQPSFGGGGPSDPGPSTSSYYPPPPNQDRPVPVPRTNIPNSSISSEPPTSNTSPYPTMPGGPSMPPSSSIPYPPYPNTGSGGTSYPGTGLGGATGGHSSGASSNSYNSAPVSTASGGSGSKGVAVKLGPEQMTKAQKYCKFASSALDYDDSPGAIDYLNKAIKLLQTGKDD